MSRCINPDCCSERQSHGREDHECEPREVRDSAYLCRGCRTRLERLLAELPSLHDDLGEALTSARRRPRGKGRSSGLNLEDAVVKARDHVRAWLFGWVRVVAEDRGVTLPLSEQPDTLAHWLGRHVDWLAHQPFADEVLVNLEETHREARWARQIVPPRRFPLKLPDGSLIHCPVPAEGPVLPDAARPTCSGVVEATVREDSALLPSQIGCSGDPAHRWAPHQWPAFGRHVRPTLDTQAMAVLAKALGA